MWEGRILDFRRPEFQARTVSNSRENRQGERMPRACRCSLLQAESIRVCAPYFIGRSTSAHANRVGTQAVKHLARAIIATSGYRALGRFGRLRRCSATNHAALGFLRDRCTLIDEGDHDIAMNASGLSASCVCKSRRIALCSALDSASSRTILEVHRDGTPSILPHRGRSGRGKRRSLVRLVVRRTRCSRRDASRVSCPRDSRRALRPSNG